MKIEENTLEQIELELTYAEATHPKQKLSLEKAIELANEKLQQCRGTIPAYKNCNICSNLEIEICKSCYAFATIAILIRGLKSVSQDTLDKRSLQLLKEIVNILDRK